MTCSEALYAKLSGDAGVIALAGDRVYPVRPADLPPGTPPNPTVVFALKSRSHEYAFGGPLLRHMTYELASYSIAYDTSAQLNEAVISALDFQQGSWGGFFTKSVELQDSDESMDPDSGIFLVITTMEIIY